MLAEEAWKLFIMAPTDKLQIFYNEVRPLFGLCSAQSSAPSSSTHVAPPLLVDTKTDDTSTTPPLETLIECLRRTISSSSSNKEETNDGDIEYSSCDKLEEYLKRTESSLAFCWCEGVGYASQCVRKVWVSNEQWTVLLRKRVEVLSAENKKLEEMTARRKKEAAAQE